MANFYEEKTHKQRFSASKIHKQGNSEVDLAKELCLARARRADTLPDNTFTASPVYQPPRFADDIIERSKQYKRNKHNKKTKSTQSQPVSPQIKSLNALSLKHRTGPNTPVSLTNSAQTIKGSFAKIQPNNQ